MKADLWVLKLYVTYIQNFSRADSGDRILNYINVSETESVSIIRVLLWFKTSLPKLYTRTSPGLPGRHYWRCATLSFE